MKSLSLYRLDHLGPPGVNGGKADAAEIDGNRIAVYA
jgi:hypothetical protein